MTPVKLCLHDWYEHKHMHTQADTDMEKYEQFNVKRQQKLPD